jgi:hypothetical protein
MVDQDDPERPFDHRATPAPIHLGDQFAMPFSKLTKEYLKVNPPVGKHVIDSRANTGKKPPRLKEIFDGSCENWSYTASKGGNRILPSAVCGDIYMATKKDAAPTVVKNNKFANIYKTMYDHIRNTFGYFDHETLGPEVGKKARNDAKAELAKCMRMVMEVTLGHNGFTLSPKNAKTEYAVCTEYECAKDKPMYPNHTHSWLEYDGKVCAQTITGSHLSLVRHHAGRPAHAGIVRTYVVDFLPDQITALEDLVANAAEHDDDIVNCNLKKDIGTLKLPADMLSPNE